MESRTSFNLTTKPHRHHRYHVNRTATCRCDISQRVRRFAGVAGLVVATLLIATASGAALYANPKLLIETDELAQLLGNGEMRIVDLRRDAKKGEAGYRAGHIPGAVYLSARELDDPKANTGGFPIRPDEATELFSQLGIDHETPVIAYDDASNRLAARLFFVLEYYGHTRTRVLNGGLGKWETEGRPLTSEVTNVAPKRFEPRAQRDLLATAEEVKAALGRKDVCLIDARTPKEFTGKDLRAKQGGHIPGAANVVWTSTLNPDRTFKSANALQAVFEAAGVRPDCQIITYCQSGGRAAQDYFALRLLGYAAVKIYDGSWKEWGNDPNLPAEK